MWDQSSLLPEHNQRSAPARLPRNKYNLSNTLLWLSHTQYSHMYYLVSIDKVLKCHFGCLRLENHNFMYLFVCLLSWKATGKDKGCQKRTVKWKRVPAISTLPSHNHQGLIVMRFPLVKQQLWLVTETAFHGTNTLAAHSPPRCTPSMPGESIWGPSLVNSTGASEMIKC